MASPKRVQFSVWDYSGNPVTGLSLTFNYYKGTDGSSPTPPTISEEGGGFYYFVPTMTANVGISYVILTAGQASPGETGYIRPEDWNEDQIPAIKADTQRIKVVGGGEGKTYIFLGSHQETIFDTDGSTVLQVYNLFDALGVPTDTDPFYRVPTYPIPP